MPRAVIIDTDTGVDDALALILALRSPELSVKAITTVAGNVEVRKCTRNVLYLLDLLHAQGNIVVSQGARKPLRRKLVTAKEVHGKDGLGNIHPASSGMRPTFRSAEDVIIDLCKRYGNKLTVIAIGPLTNIARALKKNPSAMRSMGSLVTMGGAFRVPGNTGPVAEFNYFVDPEAAHQVLTSGLRVTVVPLDLTQQIVFMRDEVEYRAQRRASPVANAILRFTKFYMQYHKKTVGFYGGYLHDPIAVAAAISPGLLQTKSAHVDVETRGILTRGMTVTDFRTQPLSNQQRVKLALKIDRERFLKLLHERLWM